MRVSIPHRLALLATVVITIVAAAPAQTRVDDAAISSLKRSALNGRALEYVVDLTRTVGARISGSAGYERAAAWAQEQFRSAGVPDAKLEPFTMPHGWEREQRARAKIVSPVETALAVESVGWAPSPPGDRVEATVVAGDEQAMASPELVRGRIVLMTREWWPDVEQRLKQAGAVAVLIADRSRDNEIAARVLRFGGEIAPLPVAILSAASADDLREAMRRGTVQVSLEYRNRITEDPVTLSNVVAEITGRERPEEFVLVGAHLDSWDFATGAQDNASGVAMILEAARAIAALGHAPRRSIRFALWGAEEQGLLGSTAYADAHAAELNRCVAVLNVDGGTARIIGWTAPGRDDVLKATRELTGRLLADLHADRMDTSMQYAFDSDGGPFIAAGIPTLDMNVDDGPYEEIHHKSTDTADRVDARNLAIGAAMTAVTAWAIADAPQRIAPRRPPVKR